MYCCGEDSVTQISGALVVIREDANLSYKRCRLVVKKSDVILEIGARRWWQRVKIFMSRCRVMQPRNPTKSEQMLLYDQVRFGQLHPLCCIDIFQGSDEESPITLIRTRQSDWSAILDHLRITAPAAPATDHDQGGHAGHEEDRASHRLQASDVDGTHLRASQKFVRT